MNLKGFDKDLRCRGFQFEIGKEYDTGAKEDEIELCTNTVFHYCKSLEKVHSYYDVNENRICEIEVLGEEVGDDEKYGSNRIKILREITGEELDVLKGHVNGNTGLFNAGYSNAGDRNTGNWNTGNRNTGNWNTGYRNTGNWNTGYRNTGNSNTGNRNTGNRNTGNSNTGYWNTGNYNTGDRNTGNGNTGNYNTGYRNTGNSNTGYWNTENYNTGDRNTGNSNTGNWNTGYRNTGNWNTGNRNTGDCNTGDWNTGNWNTGCFCTKEKKIDFFDEPSNWTYADWLASSAYKIMQRIEKHCTVWIPEDIMTDYEKEKYPTYKTTGGYLKILDESQNANVWWQSLTDDVRKVIESLPNYDEEKFKKCVGITI